ncbi:MAG: hypothetical protein RL266_2522 [Bacteroidota bacterium]|jgi:uncharacterized protein with NRDE domain
MCLCLFAIDQHDEYPFILLANRDEFRKRPSAQATFWQDHPEVLAGRDLEGMGTWLGINQRGEIAFLTNYRHPDFFNRKGPTRGKLVSDFLTTKTDAANYLSSIENPESYNGFNLVVGTPSKLFYFSNVKGTPEPIGRGIHGLSNAFLNTSWPKVDDGKSRLEAAIRDNRLQSEHLFAILKDDHLAADHQLPDTGVGHQLEKVLSAKFINTPNYGTVCSTVVMVDRNGIWHFAERIFDSEGKLQFEINERVKKGS